MTHEQHRGYSQGDGGGGTGGRLSRTLLVLWCTCGAAANGMANQVNHLRFPTFPSRSHTLQKGGKQGKRKWNGLRNICLLSDGVERILRRRLLLKGNEYRFEYENEAAQEWAGPPSWQPLR